MTDNELALRLGFRVRRHDGRARVETLGTVPTGWMESRVVVEHERAALPTEEAMWHLLRQVAKLPPPLLADLL